MTATTLDPELVAKVRALSPEQRDALFEAATEDADLPPAEDIDLVWKRIEKQHSDYLAGRVTGMTLEESETHIRTEIRKLGIEL